MIDIINKRKGKFGQGSVGNSDYGLLEIGNNLKMIRIIV